MSQGTITLIVVAAGLVLSGLLGWALTSRKRALDRAKQMQNLRRDEARIEEEARKAREELEQEFAEVDDMSWNDKVKWLEDSAD